MYTVLITGGTGLVGRALAKQFAEKGNQVIVLTRKMPAAAESSSITYALWNVNSNTIDNAAIAKADYIIHLAGAGVMDKRWTASYKKEIQESRIKSSALLAASLKNHPHKVKAFISSSAIGWYGADSTLHKKTFTETDAPAADFLGETCRLWEQSTIPVKDAGIRLVHLRTGIVLSNEGGALAEFKKPIRFGVAGILGNGKQIISWVHVDDLCRMYIAAIEKEEMHGAYNAVAPAPVSNKEFTLALAKKMKGKFFIPAYVPSFLLKLALGESSEEVLKSTTVSCQKIKDSGFTFLYPSIEAALANLCKK